MANPLFIRPQAVLTAMVECPFLMRWTAPTHDRTHRSEPVTRAVVVDVTFMLQQWHGHMGNPIP